MGLPKIATATACAPTITLDSVGKRAPDRQGTWLLERVTLDVRSRQRVFFVGPNGSGKSTLLRMILGFEHPDIGQVVLRPPICDLSVSYVPQDYRNALFPWLRLSSNLSVALRADVHSDVPKEALDSFQRLSELFRLAPGLQRYPYQLSGGEQQLFLLIVALVRKPDLLIVDEPFSAIDYGRRQLILEELGRQLATEDCTFLAVTHDFEDAVLLADRVLVLAPETAEVREVLDVPFSWPRSLTMRDTSLFRELTDRIVAATL